MSDPIKDSKQYSIQDALRAQGALREAAGLEPEMFTVQAFVGMISDEIDALRERSYSDDEIAVTIREHSAIQVSADDIRNFYASPSERGYGSPKDGEHE